MKGKLVILGCGNSTGVPAVGNHWGACDPAEPRNIRTRCSALVQIGSTTIVIDTGPDFRTQLNTADIAKLDAVFYTHHHGDHVNGIDDLRSLVFRGGQGPKPIPVYADRATLADLRTRFDYIFGGGALVELYPPLVVPHEFANFGQTHTVGNVIFTPFLQDHNTCQSVGYRFGDVAYCVDLCNLDDVALETLRGVQTWIVDGAAYKHVTPTVHANLERIYQLNKIIGAERVIITSLSLSMDYQTVRGELPNGYEPAYDGMVIPIGGAVA